jgi:putative membrane protein
MMHGWYGYSGGLGWVGMIFGALFSLALLVGLILLIVWGIRRLAGGNHQHAAPPAQVQSPAKEILQARYARGEITREQYQEILADLEK